MSVKTQGTEFWAYNPITKMLLDLGCINSIDGIDSTVDEIDTTCLRDLSRTSEAGLDTPGTASFEVQFDPNNPDHIRLNELKKAGVTLQWFVGFRFEIKGKAIVPGPAPTVEAATNTVMLPQERSWIIFNGYMSGFPFGFAQNDMVRSGVQVKISGDIEVVPSLPPVDPTSVTITPTTKAMTVGATESLVAKVLPVGALQYVNWSSNATSVAQVDDDGVVTALSAGTASIKATSMVDSSLSSICTITVT